MTEKTKSGFPGEPQSGRPVAVEPFAATLERHGLSLVRGEVHTLQINTGFLCNLRCRHCHLEAGPDRREVMSRETMSAVIAFAERFRFQAIDTTGGAPEMVPDLSFLIEGLAPIAPRLMLRTNLAALAAPAREGLLALFIVGYGVEGSRLELNLVLNPVGAFLPATQAQAEARFRRDLLRKWGVTFSNLYTFGNVPLGRFRQWLADSGNYDRYLRTLADGFNPCTVEGLMCRTQLSVSWDGYLYDGDFNLATDRYLEGRKAHVSEIRRLPPPGTPIAVGDYCYACTAGSGFT